VKGNLAANLAIAFAAIGGPLFLSILGEFADPKVMPSPAEIADARFYDLIYFFSGVALLVSSLWLSGYIFSSAPRRSLLALALCVASIFTLVLI
jgi:hypothetical protein